MAWVAPGPAGTGQVPAGSTVRGHPGGLLPGWVRRPGCIHVLRDKAELAGITVHLVDERGSSSTCPACRTRIPKPAGRTMTCPHCRTTGYRDLLAAATIATRNSPVARRTLVTVDVRPIASLRSRD